MNGYDLTAWWFEYADENPEWVDPNVTALFFAIVQRSNELRWKCKFQLPALNTMQRIGIRSPKTYYPALKKLAVAGFITVVEESKNQFTACIIQINAPVNFTSAPTLAPTSARVVAPTSAPTLARETNTNKENNTNRETNKLKKEGLLPEALKLFEQFWDAYDKKEDRKKCLDHWQKLSPSEQETVLTHAPAYVKTKPDVQYRKYPLTYLNGEVWKEPVPHHVNGSTIKQMVY